MLSLNGIYRNPKSYATPNLDLLTFLYESEYPIALPDSVLHAEAERPSIFLNKAGLQRLFEEFAFGLRKRFNVGGTGRNKDVVVLFSTGQVAYPVAFYGIIAAGGVASLASSSCTPYELVRQVQQGRANILISSPDVLDVARKAVSLITDRKVTIAVLSTEPDYSLRVDGEGEAGELRGQTIDDRLTWERITDEKELENSLVVLVYSSGTTGEPKGVMLSHQNFVSQLIISAMVRRELAAQQTLIKLPPYRSLAHLPPAHIAGVGGYLIGPSFSGGTVFWMKKYKWDDFLRYNKALKITAVYTVPSIILRITKDPKVTDHFKTMYYAAGGAAPFDGKLQKAANKKLGGPEVTVGQVYGLSETAGALTAPPPGVPRDDTGSIGEVIPNCELRLVDENDKDVTPGTPGELICRGPCVIKGYFRNPTATKNAFRNGWFCTGDIAVERNGKLYIVDRIKELIKYKGLQIAPAEIEGLLDEHPDILEAAVVGIPDPSENASSSDAAHSEIPRAYVVPAKNSKITPDAVKDLVKNTLAPYKQLRGGVVFVDELPKNELNKLLRRKLRDRALREIKGAERAKL